MRERPDHPLGHLGDDTPAALRPDIRAAVARSGLSAPLAAPRDAPLAAPPGTPWVAPAAAPGSGSGSGDAIAALLLDSLAPLPAQSPQSPHSPDHDRPPALRRRLLRRVRASAAAARVMHTVRRDESAEAGTNGSTGGVTVRLLYRTEADRPARRGEPAAVTLIELAPGARWPSSEGVLPGAPALQREWLVLRGTLRIDEVALRALDYHVVPAGHDGAAELLAAGREGALVYQRESLPVAGAPREPVTSRAAAAAWADYAPGVKRRMLWQQGGEAAMLYHGLPGAAVPHHAHAHDEECLMLAGDFFLDEVLLRPLDYQIAPAGSEHRISCTDTGVVIYAHGDVQLDLR